MATGSISKYRRAVEQHFDNIACNYNGYRTLDEAPVKYLVTITGTDIGTICSIGCGTGRYLISLLNHLKSQGIEAKAYGIDTCQAMLENAKSESNELDIDTNWLLCSATRTGLQDQSITLITSFNSIHHLPIEDTLNEVKRILMPNGFFAIYTRVLEQESGHLWGRYFPEYVDHSTVFTKEAMSNFSIYDKRWQLANAKDFTFERNTTLTRICEQTLNKHYSTLARYPEKEFEVAYETFVNNIETSYKDLDNIQYLSSYSLFLYQYI